MKIITLRDTDGKDAITVIIMHVIRVIFSSKTEGTLPTLYLLTNRTVCREHCKATISSKLVDFERTWELLLNI